MNSRLQFPILSVLCDKVAWPGNTGAVVLLNVTLGLGVVSGPEHIFSPQGLPDMLGKPGRELFIFIVRQEARWAVGHDKMGYKSFSHTIGCNKSERSGVDKFRKQV